MAEQRIRECLAIMENLYITNDDQSDSIAERIQRIAFELNDDEQEYRVNLFLLQEHPSELTYQQVLYQLIPWLNISETRKRELTILLLGENDEYILEGEGLYTDDTYSKVYETIVKEHMHSWREGYFEPEDLEGDELLRHFDCVEYAKQHGL
jgi:hypothetical protein